MLGQALLRKAKAGRHEVIGAARRDADCTFDLADAASIASAIEDAKPSHVVNAAGVVDLNACESYPGPPMSSMPGPSR